MHPIGLGVVTGAIDKAPSLAIPAITSTLDPSPPHSSPRPRWALNTIRPLPSPTPAMERSAADNRAFLIGGPNMSLGQFFQALEDISGVPR